MQTFEDQLEEIRIRLYEETKDMPTADAVRLVNDRARKIGEKYGFRLIKESPYVTTTSKAINNLS
jgi:hypothetical protein